jgi:hypothetical protein
MMSLVSRVRDNILYIFLQLLVHLSGMDALLSNTSFDLYLASTALNY